MNFYLFIRQCLDLSSFETAHKETIALNRKVAMTLTRDQRDTVWDMIDGI